MFIFIRSGFGVRLTILLTIPSHMSVRVNFSDATAELGVNKIAIQNNNSVLEFIIFKFSSLVGLFISIDYCYYTRSKDKKNTPHITPKEQANRGNSDSAVD